MDLHEALHCIVGRHKGTWHLIMYMRTTPKNGPSRRSELKSIIGGMTPCFCPRPHSNGICCDSMSIHSTVPNASGSDRRTALLKDLMTRYKSGNDAAHVTWAAGVGALPPEDLEDIVWCCEGRGMVPEKRTRSARPKDRRPASAEFPEVRQEEAAGNCHNGGKKRQYSREYCSLRNDDQSDFRDSNDTSDNGCRGKIMNSASGQVRDLENACPHELALDRRLFGGYWRRGDWPEDANYGQLLGTPRDIQFRTATGEIVIVDRTTT